MGRKLEWLICIPILNRAYRHVPLGQIAGYIRWKHFFPRVVLRAEWLIPSEFFDVGEDFARRGLSHSRRSVSRANRVY